MRFYKLDMGILVRENTMSLRMFQNLIKGLPAESAYARFIGNRENYQDGLINK
jgi:hypothetical protein